jgi:hypothetical protein
MYINTTTGTYPVSEQQIRAENNNVSYPSPFIPPPEYNYVFPAPKPNYNSNTQTVKEVQPELTNLGHWEQRWVTESIPVEIVQANLAQAKLAKNTQINEWRAKANQTKFTHAGKDIACDALSRSDIDAIAGSVALNGVFPSGFPNAWKSTDNSYIVLVDVAAFKDFYGSMTLQGTVNFGRSQQLKTTLAACTTIEEVNAITWE